jgi:long-chain acyl-CoA synthetase
MRSTEEIAAWVEEQTITRWFRDAVRELPDAVALRARNSDGSWTQRTWAEVAQDATTLAARFADLGVGPGDRVLLFMRNRPEFHVADLAAVLLRAVPVSPYNSSSVEQIEYLAGHCDARIAVVDGPGFIERVLAARDRLPGLRAVVSVDEPNVTMGTDVGRPDDVLRYGDLVARTAAAVDLDDAAAAARADDLVTVIYTSGTTGPPKGVMLDHSNVAWQVAGYTDLIGPVQPGMRAVSYLPMAHVAERMVTHYGWLYTRAVVSCCPDLTQLALFLAEVHPQNLFGPPRVWEKLRAGILAAVAAAGPESEAAFGQALGLGSKVAQARHESGGGPIADELEQMWTAVDAAAFAPLRQRTGLDELRYGFSGAAPLAPEVFEFFRAIGLPFSEIYGMSENTGGMTWTPYLATSGNVGRPYPGAQVRLGDDGEVLCRGGIVSRGYLDDPVRTAETFDSDGWLHTGDIGEWDADGNLRIVDRKKELIITAGGKNISPANLEARLKASPLIGQAAVVGDRRPYLIALLVLDPEVTPAWAAARGVQGRTLAELAEDPLVLDEVERVVTEANSHVSQVEAIRRWVVLGEEWAPDSEQLTATMKLKRRGVQAAYADRIDALYADGEPG